MEGKKKSLKLRLKSRQLNKNKLIRDIPESFELLYSIVEAFVKDAASGEIKFTIKYLDLSEQHIDLINDQDFKNALAVGE
jgi:hypothetical protein